jgi:hypothetical protein
MHRPIVWFRALAPLALAACASPPPPVPPPQRPPLPPPVASEAAPAPAVAVPVEPAPTPPLDSRPADTVAPPAAPAADDGPGRSQKPLDILTARDAAFQIDYANSEAKTKAAERCEKEAKGDAEKQGACIAKARDAFMADVLRFKKESETRTLFVVYKRAGSVLREVSTGPVTLEEQGETVKLKFLSTKGARPLWTGAKEASIKVPNDYSIELDDPTHGHLRYDAKIGLVTE